MLILALETAAGAVGAAVSRDGEVLAVEQRVGARQHAELLTPLIQQVCAAADIDVRDIDVVAVDIGPGLFTGLRVGIATAFGVSFASGAPLVGVTSLDLLAEGVAEVLEGRGVGRRVVAAIDARRGEVFHATYSLEPTGPARVTEPSVSRPEALAEQITSWGDEVVLVGDALDRHADAFVACPIAALDPLCVSNHHDPQAAVLARLAFARAKAGPLLSPATLTPLYLRSPDIDRTWLDKQVPA